MTRGNQSTLGIYSTPAAVSRPVAAAAAAASASAARDVTRESPSTSAFRKPVLINGTHTGRRQVVTGLVKSNAGAESPITESPPSEEPTTIVKGMYMYTALR